MTSVTAIDHQLRNGEITLPNLLDMSINSSIVNFDVLKLLLGEMLNVSNANNHKVDGEKVEQITSNSEATCHSPRSQLNLNNQDNNQERMSNAENKLDNLQVIERKRDNDMNKIKEQLYRLESQLESVKDLGNNEILSKYMKGSNSSKTDPESEDNRENSAVVYAWNSIQLNKRVEANESGITRLTELLEKLLQEMKELENAQSKLQNKLSDLEKEQTSNDVLDEMKENMKNLSNKFSDYDERLKKIDEELKEKLDRKEFDGLTNMIQALQNEIDELRKRIETTEKEMKEKLNEKDKEQLQEQIDDLKKLFEMLKENLKNLDDRVNKNSEEEKLNFKEETAEKVQDIKHGNQPRKSSVDDSKTKLMSKDIDKCSKSLDDALSKMNNIFQQLATADDQLRSLQQSINDLIQSNLTASQSKTDDNHQTEPIIKTKIERSDTDENFRKEVEEYMRRLNDLYPGLADELKNLKNKFGNNEKELSELKKLLKNLRQQLANSQNKIANMSNERNNDNDNDNNNNNNNQTDISFEDILNLQKDFETNEKLLQQLQALCRQLQEEKADRSEIRKKSGKSTPTVDDITAALSRQIDNLKRQLSDIDNLMNENQKKTNEELNLKIEKDEIEEFKKELEKQLKKMKRLLKNLNVEQPVQPHQHTYVPVEDDAAGLRRPVFRYNCLSCDRPIDVNSSLHPTPVAPLEKALKAMTGPNRAVSIYEMDQLRQFQKLQAQNIYPPSKAYIQAQALSGLKDFSNYHSINRQVGGTHTATSYPHRKVIRQALDSETNDKNRMDITGTDGHLYKGQLPLMNGGRDSIVKIPISPKMHRKHNSKIRLKTSETISNIPPLNMRPNSANKNTESQNLTLNRSITSITMKPKSDNRPDDLTDIEDNISMTKTPLLTNNNM
ncbi:hypothetical protein SNEBB_000479 [Seison nebaliae]|nr:hypothetical protein SNEBB_000479 [Seison nebaliae]